MQLTDLSDDLGKKLTSYSRLVLTSYIKDHKELEPLLDSKMLQEKSGVFCTLRKYGQLRGCIGYPYPSHPLGEALVKATIQSGVEDPRFPAVTEKELKDITIELTILTPPELIKVNKFEDYYNEITIGVDGLIIEHKGRRGLLLPQVPVEQHWTIDEYLEGICHKAYLSTNAWKDIENTKLYKFSGKIFEE